MGVVLNVLILLALCATTAVVPDRLDAAPAELGLITGGERGTYYQFGLDIQRLLKQPTTPTVALSVYPSKGSVENIYAVYQRPATQMGIVQSDVLAFVFRIQSDPVLRRIARKVKLVFPLYNEEIHILGRKGIVDFDDLADRRVAIGREGSGTYLRPAYSSRWRTSRRARRCSSIPTRRWPSSRRGGSTPCSMSPDIP